MEVGSRVTAFDTLDWILSGRPDDKTDFWKPATIVKINEPHHDVPETITISWHNAGVNTSHGHHRKDLRD
jgi:hypothetical protein